MHFSLNRLGMLRLVKPKSYITNAKQPNDQEEQMKKKSLEVKLGVYRE